MPITAIDIAALRAADDVVFRHRNGTSQIEAIQRGRAATPGNPFAPGEARRDIPCDARVIDYQRDCGMHRKPSEYQAFDMLNAAQQDHAWLTVAALLRPGDSLTLQWERGAWNTQESEGRGMYGDRMLLVVLRPGKSKDTRLTFNVAHHFGPDNSARMVRPAEYRLAEVA